MTLETTIWRCISCQVSFMEDNVLKYIGAHTLSNSSGLVAALVSYGNIVKSQCFIVVDHLVNIPRNPVAFPGDD